MFTLALLLTFTISAEDCFSHGKTVVKNSCTWGWQFRAKAKVNKLLSVYPNPSSGLITKEFDSNESKNQSGVINLYNYGGQFVKQIYEGDLNGFNSNFSLFDTPNYSTRIYVYEPYVLYSFSVPAFYGEGQRIVGVLKCKINRQLSLNFKIAQTLYYDNTPIRSGSIKGDKLTDFKILVKYVL